jgi:Flp pilus assembly protein TadG
MNSRRAKTMLGFVRETRASEIAEAALVLPIMFMVLMGIFWFGEAFSAIGTLTHAARMGARAAVAPTCSTCAAGTPATNAATAVNNALLAAHLNPNNLVANPTGAPNTLVSCADGSTPVNCDSSPTRVCVQENVQLSSTTNGGAGVCGIAVSLKYKYPYHFHLPCYPQPCTSLDLGNMALAGEAEMRLETQ